MRLFDAAQSTEALPGTWIEHSKGIDVLIRALTPAEDKKIERQYGARKVTGTRHGPTVDVNYDKADGALLARAELALIDTRGAETMIVDGESAEIYGRLLGFPVKVGELVKLDGKWALPELKRQALRDAPLFMAWVARKSSKLRETEAVDEEGKDEG